MFFIKNLLSGKKVPLYGTGKNMRDWIFVEDNCSGIDFAATKGKIGEAYNVGGGNELPNTEITNRILHELKKDSSWIELVTDRPGHDLRYSLDCSKMKKLGWKPKHDFADALRKTVQWFKDNDEWWKPLKRQLVSKGQVK